MVLRAHSLTPSNLVSCQLFWSMTSFCESFFASLPSLTSFSSSLFPMVGTGRGAIALTLASNVACRCLGEAPRE